MVLILCKILFQFHARFLWCTSKCRLTVNVHQTLNSEPKKKTASFYSHIESHHISVHTIPGNHFPFGRALLFDRVILTFKKLMANSPTLSKDCCKMRCISITKNYNKKQSAHYSLHTGTQPYNCNVAGNEAGVVLS